jgi:hypothetical protein
MQELSNRFFPEDTSRPSIDPNLGAGEKIFVGFDKIIQRETLFLFKPFYILVPVSSCFFSEKVTQQSRQDF